MKAAAEAGPSLRPPRAVVGSQVSFEEEMFGAAFDGRVVRRFGAFVAPYRRRVWIGVAAVLVFTLTQVAIPLVLRYAIDDALVAGDSGVEALRWIVAAFFAVVGLNYASNFTQELVVGRISGSVLFDLRRAMYRHLQHVSLSFMDRTEVGRLMSRLQGDVNALQEFLETSIFAIGDFVLLVGIVAVLLALDLELGLLTLAVVPVLVAVRIVWLPRARRAFLRARETSSIVNGALAENVHGIRTIPGDGTGSGQLRALRREGEGQPRRAPSRVEVLQRHDPHRRHADRHRDGGGDRGRGRHGARAGARARGDGGIPVLRAALLRPYPLAQHPVQHHAAGDGGGTAHLRGARRARRGARPARRGPAAARGARHRAR